MATSELPHPTENWAHFKQAVHDANERAGHVWNPSSRYMSNWILMSKLGHLYGREGACAIL
jgi:hypothetical protein